MSGSLKNIAVAYGDGIGPEIMEATLYILKGAKANIQLQAIEIGEKVYNQGFTSGITPEAWETVRRCQVLLKAPITTPQGGGYKSLNVTLRKSLGLFTNIRPVNSYYPYVGTYAKGMDMVIIRENEEDLYAGIEYKATGNSNLAFKIITEKGSRRIIRYAFEYAKANNRKKVTCLSKDNIMKLTDGTFHKVFNEIAAEYPNIKPEHYIIDIGAARLATRPEDFDVVVTENLYGDIVSDIVAEVSGSVGIAGSGNIGSKYAMFEAVHGSAPDIAGQGVANPSGLLNGAIMMLEYIDESQTASLIRNAWLKTIEDGIHTADIYHETTSARKVSTMEFAEAVVNNLGGKPKEIVSAKSSASPKVAYVQEVSKPQTKKLIGADIYISEHREEIKQLAETINELPTELVLHSISQRGSVLWPKADLEFFDNDFIRLRFVGKEEDSAISATEVADLQKAISNKLNLEIISVQYLSKYGDSLGFSLAQGE